MSFFELRNITYSYDGKKDVLKDVSALFEQGKMYSVLGESGCGKTTLLSVMSGLDNVTNGGIIFRGQLIRKKMLTKFRAENISMIFQDYNLIDYMNAKENAEIVTTKSSDVILERLGLKPEEIKRNILKLSGGQQQRVAIARALLSDAEILLADEPTGNLDKKNAIEIAKILLEAAHKYNKCVIVVTHSSDIAEYADVIMKLEEKKLKEVKLNDA